MASACYSPIADGYPYGSIFELGMESSKPSASSNAQPLGFAAWLKLSEVEAPASTSTDDRRFRLAPPIGQSSRTANLSDDEGFPFLREFLPHPKLVIDLTLDSDGDDDDAIETASTLSPNSPRFSPSLRKSPSHTADDLTTSTTVATPGRKSYPWKNVPRWSKLYDKLQQHSATPLHNQPTAEALHVKSISTEFGRPPKDSRGPVAEQPENSPEIPETPAVALEGVRRGDDEQTLALTTVSASSLSDVGEDGPTIVDISKLTTVKVLDKRSGSSGVEYKCELEPLWLAADLAERAQMGRVHIRSYENGLVRDRRLKTLRVRKRKFLEM